jgi:hypothetical protein
VRQQAHAQRRAFEVKWAAWEKRARAQALAKASPHPDLSSMRVSSRLLCRRANRPWC